jgi:hypothetical protein
VVCVIRRLSLPMVGSLHSSARQQDGVRCAEATSQVGNQDGSAALGRWAGASAAALPWEARAAHAGDALSKWLNRTRRSRRMRHRVPLSAPSCSQPPLQRAEGTQPQLGSAPGLARSVSGSATPARNQGPGASRAWTRRRSSPATCGPTLGESARSLRRPTGF